jgi:hypothetical protein
MTAVGTCAPTLGDRAPWRAVRNAAHMHAPPVVLRLHRWRSPGCLEPTLMRLPSLLLFTALSFTACADDPPPITGAHVNALTGAACVPDEATYVDRALRTRTTQLDCTAETTDIDHPEYCCEFPQPGCDGDGCCDADMVEPPGID